MPPVLRCFSVCLRSGACCWVCETVWVWVDELLAVCIFLVSCRVKIDCLVSKKCLLVWFV